MPFGAEGVTSFGMGWHDVERSNDGVEFRWTSARDAEVLVPVAATGNIQVRLRVSPFEYPRAPQTTVTLKVNSAELASRPLVRGSGRI